MYLLILCLFHQDLRALNDPPGFTTKYHLPQALIHHDTLLNEMLMRLCEAVTEMQSMLAGKTKTNS